MLEEQEQDTSKQTSKLSCIHDIYYRTSTELRFCLYFREKSGKERMLDTHEEPGSFSLEHYTNAEEKQRLRFCKTPVGFSLTSPIYFQ